MSTPQIPEILRFEPWPPWDPVPDWLLRVLDDKALTRLAVVQLERRKAVLEVELKAAQELLEIVHRRR